MDKQEYKKQIKAMVEFINDEDRLEKIWTMVHRIFTSQGAADERKN